MSESSRRLVLKFGGTSMADAKRIAHSAAIAAAEVARSGKAGVSHANVVRTAPLLRAKKSRRKPARCAAAGAGSSTV